MFPDAFNKISNGKQLSARPNLLDFGSKIKKIIKLQVVAIFESQQIDLLAKSIMPACIEGFVN
jgi:hypothetical protein